MVCDPSKIVVLGPAGPQGVQGIMGPRGPEPVMAYMEVTSISGQTVTSGVTLLAWDTEVVDNQGAWSYNTFTCRLTGIYHIDACAAWNAGLTNYIEAFKNGSSFARSPSNDGLTDSPCLLATMISLVAGDILTFNATGSGGQRNLVAAGNRITISRVGAL